MNSAVTFNQQDVLSTSQIMLLVLICVVLLGVWFYLQRLIKARMHSPQGIVYQPQQLAAGVRLHRLQLDGAHYTVFESAGQLLLLDKKNADSTADELPK